MVLTQSLHTVKYEQFLEINAPKLVSFGLVGNVNLYWQIKGSYPVGQVYFDDVGQAITGLLVVQAMC